MIAKMSKYDFVLYAAQSTDFIERLRGLGLVDITTAGWEPSEADRQLLLDIEGRGKAAEWLRQWAAQPEHAELKGEPYASGEEAWTAYTAAQQRLAAGNAELARLEKAAAELRPWGEFSVEELQKLADGGVTVRFFVASMSVYEELAAAWEGPEVLSLVNDREGAACFVVAGTGRRELAVDAQEMKFPTMDIREAERRIAACRGELASLDAEFARAAASLDLLESDADRLKERLEEVQVVATAAEAAEGQLLVLRGWAEKATSAKVDALLDEYPNVIYLKSDPTPEDDTPVKLNNDRFSRIFELIGDMYARPKYGTMDLTPFFAPFYMLFFGICLNDAGYGLVLLLLGLGILFKFREPGMMQRAGWFATMCALSTILFGGFCGSFFGLSLGEYFPSVHFFDFQNRFFSIALMIGVVQIMLAMVLNICVISRCFGIKYAFGQLGWFLILLACVLAAGLPMVNPAWTIPGFETGSAAFYAVIGVGAVLMLLLNTPGRNPLLNFGSGLWTLYNNITGLLSDVLSYIRLFAIGLSGGVLALVFNSLADGFVPEGASLPVRILIMVPILLIGHGINLFMSAISSFVHPMRLTFVEFFKNAGFESAHYSFRPLQKSKTNK